MQIGLPLPYFESEGFEDRNRQYHESGTDESDADGFFVTFVHTAAKVRNKTDIRHKFVHNIPDIWKDKPFALPLHSEMSNLTALRNEYEHETKNNYRHSICCSQSVEARYAVGYPPLALV
jgi:hypothetical protein